MSKEKKLSHAPQPYTASFNLVIDSTQHLNGLDKNPKRSHWRTPCRHPSQFIPNYNFRFNPLPTCNQRTAHFLRRCRLKGLTTPECGDRIMGRAGHRKYRGDRCAVVAQERETNGHSYKYKGSFCLSVCLMGAIQEGFTSHDGVSYNYCGLSLIQTR